MSSLIAQDLVQHDLKDGKRALRIDNNYFVWDGEMRKKGWLSCW